MSDNIPALLVADGKARRGTLVQVLVDGTWQKGTAAELDFTEHKIAVALENGETLHVNASEVHRQHPQPSHAAAAPGGHPPAAPAADKKGAECPKCKGKGERKAVAGVVGKLVECKECHGKGHI